MKKELIRKDGKLDQNKRLTGKGRSDMNCKSQKIS